MLQCNVLDAPLGAPPLQRRRHFGTGRVVVCVTVSAGGYFPELLQPRDKALSQGFLGYADALGEAIMRGGGIALVAEVASSNGVGPRSGSQIKPLPHFAVSILAGPALVGGRNWHYGGSTK